MARLLLMTPVLETSATVLPALGLLTHHLQVVGHDVAATLTDHPYDVILIDARTDLVGARTLCRTLHAVATPPHTPTRTPTPVIVVVTEGGLAAVTGQWQVSDFLLQGAGPAEVEARLRLAVSTSPATDRAPAPDGPISRGALVIDESAYTVRVGGRALDLTYKEFELLKRLAQHPGRVATRAQLLQDVWDYDYYGGTRTVDVHIRRLRAKLGAEYESMIVTVRNVGYRFVADTAAPPAHAAAPETTAQPESG